MTPNFNIPNIPAARVPESTATPTGEAASDLAFAEELQGEESRQNFLSEEKNAYEGRKAGMGLSEEESFSESIEEKQVKKHKAIKNSNGTDSALKESMPESILHQQDALRVEVPSSEKSETYVSLPLVDGISVEAPQANSVAAPRAAKNNAPESAEKQLGSLQEKTTPSEKSETHVSLPLVDGISIEALQTNSMIASRATKNYSPESTIQQLDSLQEKTTSSEKGETHVSLPLEDGISVETPQTNSIGALRANTGEDLKATVAEALRVQSSENEVDVVTEPSSLLPVAEKDEELIHVTPNPTVSLIEETDDAVEVAQFSDVSVHLRNSEPIENISEETPPTVTSDKIMELASSNAVDRSNQSVRTGTGQNGYDPIESSPELPLGNHANRGFPTSSNVTTTVVNSAEETPKPSIQVPKTAQAENNSGRENAVSQKPLVAPKGVAIASGEADRVSTRVGNVPLPADPASSRATAASVVPAQDLEQITQSANSQSKLSNITSKETVTAQSTVASQSATATMAESRKEGARDKSRSRGADGKPAILKADSKTAPVALESAIARGAQPVPAAVSARGHLAAAQHASGKGNLTSENASESARTGSQEEPTSNFRAQTATGAQRADSTTASSRPVQVHSIYTRITNAAEQMKQEQISTLQLRLSLGKGESVRIQLNLRGQNLRTVIYTDSDALRSAFRDGWDSFSRAMSDKGVQTDGLQFSMSDQERRNSSSQNEREEQAIHNQELAQLAALRSAISSSSEPSASDSEIADAPAETQQRFTRFA